MRLDEDERLRALESLAVAEDVAADDYEGIPTAIGTSSFVPRPLETATEVATPALNHAPNYRAEALPRTQAESAAVGPSPSRLLEDHEDVAPIPAGATKAPSAARDWRPARPDATAERLSALQSLAREDDGSEARMREAHGRDRMAVLDDNLRSALAGRGTPRQLPSEVDFESKLTGRTDARKAALIKAYAERNGQGFDPSLAQRRKDLSEEAHNRSELAKLKFEEAKRAGGSKEELDAAKLELDKAKAGETERYHAGLLNKPGKGAKAGAGSGRPLPVIKEGDLATVPENDRALVRGLLEGKIGIASIPAKSRERLQNETLRVDPTWDSTRFGAYKRVVESQATDKSIMAQRVARHHISTARASIPKSASPQFVNRAKQAFITGKGSGEFIKFGIAGPFVAHEVAKVMNIDDQAGKAMVEHLLGAAQTTEQLTIAFDTIDELIEGKQQGVDEQRAAVAPTTFGAPKAAPAAAHGAAPAAGGTVRVKMKSGPNAGRTGSVPAAKFDPAKHEKLDG